MTNQQIIQKTRILLELFKVHDKPANEAMSDGQCLIVGSIVFKIKPRISCLAPTGYGKSEAVAMGVILRTVIKKEHFIIASVKFGTSDIIMGKVIDHLFDDEFLTYQMELEKGLKLDRLRRERKKYKINFREGGSIKIISLHGKDDEMGTAIGEHAANIILDESPLLTPVKYLQILKILEGTGDYYKTFLFELGNAVNRNHFMNNVLYNPDFFKVNISLEQAVKEGRLDTKSIEEKRGMPFFEQFYECKFPDEDEIDDNGYRSLLTESDIEDAFVDTVEKEEDRKLGVDVGGGGDYNVYVTRGSLYAFIDRCNRSNDTMVNVNEVISLMDERDIEDTSVFIDDIGIGRGPSDRLKELDHDINSVSVGSASTDPSKYANLKAECYWAVRMWIKAGGKLKRDERFRQLTWIRYKINTDKVLKIEPKQDLKKRMGKSPDFAEALMLTFAPTTDFGMDVL